MKVPQYLTFISPDLRELLISKPHDVLTDLNGRPLLEACAKQVGTAESILTGLCQMSVAEYEQLKRGKDDIILNTLLALDVALFDVRIGIETGVQAAEREGYQINTLLAEAMPHIAIDLVYDILQSVKSSEFHLRSETYALGRQRVRDALMAGSDSPATSPQHTPDEMVSTTLSDFPSYATPYDVYEQMFGQGAPSPLPFEYFAGVAQCFLMSSMAFAHTVALLLLLHQDAEVRLAVSDILIEMFRRSSLSLSESNQSRLHQIMRWLPTAEQQILCRGLMMEMDKPPPKVDLTLELVEARAYLCDGVGAYASTVALHSEHGYHLIQVLSKEGEGIKDSFTVPTITDMSQFQAQRDEMIHVMVDQGITTMPVTLEGLLPQWQHFLAVGLEQDRPPLPAFLGLIEGISPSYVDAKRLDVDEASDDLLQYLPKDVSATWDVTRSWLEPFGEINMADWFLRSRALTQAVLRTKRQNTDLASICHSVMMAVVLPTRTIWQTRFIFAALMLRYTLDDEFAEMLSDMVVLVDAARTVDKFTDNPFMRALVAISVEIELLEQTKWGDPLEVIK